VFAWASWTLGRPGPLESGLVKLRSEKATRKTMRSLIMKGSFIQTETFPSLSVKSYPKRREALEILSAIENGGESSNMPNIDCASRLRDNSEVVDDYAHVDDVNYSASVSVPILGGDVARATCDDVVAGEAIVVEDDRNVGYSDCAILLHIAEGKKMNLVADRV
jgi:hypothetical protein